MWRCCYTVVMSTPIRCVILGHEDEFITEMIMPSFRTVIEVPKRSSVDVNGDYSTSLADVTFSIERYVFDMMESCAQTLIAGERLAFYRPCKQR